MKSLLVVAALFVAGILMVTGCGRNAQLDVASDGSWTMIPRDGLAAVDSSVAAPNAAKDIFVTKVHPAMVADCMKCHHSSGFTRFMVTSDAEQTYAIAKKLITAGNYQKSLIASKSRGISHGGGQRWPDTSQQQADLKDWINAETP